MTPQIIIAAVIAAIGFGSGWHIQALRYTAKEAEHAKQKLAQVQQSAAADIRRFDNTIIAQRAATAREVALRRDRDSANSQLERLRDALRSDMPGTSSTGDACPVRADPARELFIACTEALVEMGGRADRHASDVKTLTDGWPK